MTKPRHRWSEPIPFQFHTERHCVYCTLIKITMHPAANEVWREWQYGQDIETRFKSDSTPDCIAGEEVAAI